jgi:hypothetical protein
VGALLYAAATYEYRLTVAELMDLTGREERTVWRHIRSVFRHAAWPFKGYVSTQLVQAPMMELEDEEAAPPSSASGEGLEEEDDGEIDEEGP